MSIKRRGRPRSATDVEALGYEVVVQWEDDYKPKSKCVDELNIQVIVNYSLSLIRNRQSVTTPQERNYRDESPRSSLCAPVPFPRDDPPPGYTDFYGWHQGVFHGLTVTDPVQLAKYREESVSLFI